jgi:predicted GIY-YIG superfamily endonuclease
MALALRFLPPMPCRVARKRGKTVLLQPLGRRQFTFQKPATSPKKQKLYVVTAEDEVLYVGRTSRPMADRIRIGLRPGKRKGYYGYRWRRPMGRPLVLRVCMTGRSMDMTEAIEAEFVLAVRSATGRWPKGQTEIHFHNIPGAAKLAARLYAELNPDAVPL